MATDGSTSVPGDQRPMRADARRNYARLLAAADEAFRRDGVEASLEGIAKAAGVAIGTLYRHFPTREDLLLALLGGRVECLQALGAELMEDDEPGPALVRWLHEFAHRSGAYQGLSASVIATIQDRASALFGSCQDMQQTAQALLDRAQAVGAVRGDVDAGELMALVAGLASAAECAPDRAPRIDRFVDILVQGLAPPATTTPG